MTKRCGRSSIMAITVKEILERLGVSTHSLYKKVKPVKPSPQKQRDEVLLEAKRENLKLRAALRRTVEVRDIQKIAASCFAREDERSTPSLMRIFISMA